MGEDVVALCSCFNTINSNWEEDKVVRMLKRNGRQNKY